MQDCEPVIAAPQAKSINLVPETKMKAVEIATQPYKYRELVGYLQYLVRGTWANIANAVRNLINSLSCFNETHWREAKRVLRYLKGTSTY